VQLADTLRAHREQDNEVPIRKTQTTTTKRQTQKGVARASAARKRTNEQAAKVRNIGTARKAAQQQVEETIADVLTGKTTAKAAEKRVEQVADSYAADLAAAQKSEAAKSSTPRKRIAEKKTAAKKTAETIKPQDEKRTAAELRETLRGETALANADAIVAAAKRLQATEKILAEKEIDARNPATVDSYKVHRDRDAAIQELIELGAGWTFIARVRGVASSTNRGLCRVLMGGERI
jgi:hypothetical protein